jgi:enediyne biosynthesis thioesterase
MSSYTYHHRVGFEETSLIGNVYFSNYLIWQGHCREFFLRDEAPEVLDDLREARLAFFTRSCSCDFDGDLGFSALEDVQIEMQLLEFRGGRMTLAFDYLAPGRAGARVARGRQQIACKRKNGSTWVPAPFPAALARALLRYAEGETLRQRLQEVLAFLGDEAV